MGLIRTVDPVLEPVTLQEIKTHARVVHTDEDVYLEGLIAAARDYVETFTNRSIITQTWALTLPGFPCYFQLPKAPLISVSSITYVDTDGATQTLATSVYDVDTTTEPGRVVLAYNQSWPSTRDDIAAVTVTYTAGYGTARTDVPASLRLAIKILSAHWFELREPVVFGSINEVPMSVTRLLWSNRLLGVA